MKLNFLYTVFFILSITAVNAQQRSEFPALKENALKINLLSPAYGNLSVTYQHLINPVKSINITVGYIDFDDYTRFDAGYKFRMQGFSIIPEYRTNFTGYGLNGTYAAPFLRYMNYQTTDTEILSNGTKKEETGSIQSLGIGFVIGRQHIIKNRVLFDYFIGPAYQVIIDNVGRGSSDYLPSISDRYLSGYSVRAGITIGLAY
jgi:hypothetical protein